MLALFLRHRKLIFLILVTLLGLACGQLAGTILGVSGDLELSRLPVGSAAGVVAKPADPAHDLAFILQNHPFDATARSATPVNFVLRQADFDPATMAAQGDLELRGTVVAGKRSLALIRNGQEIKLYRLGESLPGGGTLEEVSRHAVKIRGASQTVTTLPLFEGDAAAGGTPPAAEIPSRPGRSESAGSTLRTVGANRWIIPRAEVEAIRDNFSEQLGMALMQPQVVNGRTVGFVIKRIAPGALLAKMGLIRGDIVKYVNETSVDSPEKALQILQQLREARQLTVAIERNGTPLTFNYEID